MYTIKLITPHQTIYVDFTGSLDQAKATAIKLSESDTYPNIYRILIYETKGQELEQDSIPVSIWQAK